MSQLRGELREGREPSIPGCALAGRFSILLVKQRHTNLIRSDGGHIGLGMFCPIDLDELGPRCDRKVAP